MALTVNTNIPSLTAQRNLGLSNDMLAKSLERLSSGLRVNRSADDAAGLSIATKLSMQSRGLRVAVRNASDAGSLVNTAEGAFNVATNIIGRLRELAVQAASDTNTAQDRTTLSGESTLLVAELNRLAGTTEFNGATLLDGSFSSGKIQVGANADQTITFSLGDVRAAQLGKFAAFSVNIADGIGNVSGAGSTFSGFGNVTTGEFTINGQLVGGTNTTDDQVSVLELFYKNNLGTSLALGDGTPAFSGVAASHGASGINSTSLSAALVSTGTGGSKSTISTAFSNAVSAATAATSTTEVLSTAFSQALSVTISAYTSIGTNDAVALASAIAMGASVAGSVASTMSTGTATAASAAISAFTSQATALVGSGVTSGTGSAATSNADVNLAFALATGRGALYINGTAITSIANGSGASVYSGASATFATNSSFVSAFVAKINAAGITNVTARQNADGSTYVLVAAKGADLKLAFSAYQTSQSYNSVYSNIGLVSQVVGSGNATSEVSTYNGQSGAIAKAAAINSVKSKSAVGAVAIANVNSQATGVTAGTLAANDLFINGYAIDATANITTSDGSGALRSAINAKTASTGVTATVNNTGALVLSAADGRNITLFASSNAATITGASAGVNVYRGAIKLTSQSDVRFAGVTTDIGSASTSTPYTADLTNSVALMDITTQDGANTAIMTLDAALARISQVRSDVGALLSRLDLTMQALAVSAENQEAAASRIKDADFAYETAQFTRNQILVQAGTAILAQANSTTQIALQLLQR